MLHATTTVKSILVSARISGQRAYEPSLPGRTDGRTVLNRLLAESGRGLRLVRELSEAWGWRDDAAGRTVWFAVAGE
ncbi:ATP-binding protein [Sphaerisporangium sp. NPDC051017]|uniref:ATP-binding protein n=1 Tax=Sphaerisporangium sp. NPDC051017 TaxID=3154636 RepID=UPI0034413F81